MSQFGFGSSRVVPAHSQRAKPPPPFAIGSRAIVTAPQHLATLTQRDGATVIGTISAGIEVVIDGWIPPRDGGLRYLVASPADAAYGWLHPDFLTLVPRPAPPKPLAPITVPSRTRPRKSKANTAGTAPKSAPKATRATVAGAKERQ